ncbi:MAG TPA: bifunctional diaminohydroxyphosphoribosylaminopyrimidine deaminase/5-amino-6-(5-phosphoribosylamino)uracil reductase RibD [Vicinamibacteria bacterium]|nr:bifunctional diaminohydroxyphosphoribosylaminopyrimidine deaminase/5-amino-6-(5-phosphoribosylamino)uracil reductase RibD [Vicinamibacteria bacterium]
MGKRRPDKAEPNSLRRGRGGRDHSAPRLSDEAYLGRALRLAARGLGETNPNPLVGCVIVKAGRVVGEGFHARAGAAHAEVQALARAGARARGATLYTNLEPCAHHGRTPPCAPAVVRAGIRRVVAAMRDPDPRVNGRGFAVLRRAGVELRVGVLEPQALLLNERFVVSSRARRPFVLLKVAMTLDGRIATARGESRWITSPGQRRTARGLRRLHDAVAVGVGTVLADDPLLLPRPSVGRPFHRVVFDTRLRTPPRARLLRTARRAPVWLLSAAHEGARRRALEAAGATVLRAARGRGGISLRSALRALWARGIRSLMVEGGSELLGSFLAERLFDEVAIFRAPLLLGGRGSLPAFGGPDPARLSKAVRLVRRRTARGAGYELWYPEPRRRGR